MHKREPLFIGLDFGTSACTAVAVDAQGALIAYASAPLPPPLKQGSEVTQDARLWWAALRTTLGELRTRIDFAQVQALAVDGTSGTILVCDANGTPLGPALCYNDKRAQTQADLIAEVAEPTSGAHGPTSGLAKLLWLHDRELAKDAAHCLHQADWIAGRLCGAFGQSDYNNALKLGYDAVNLRWPAWISTLGLAPKLLPEVRAPGALLGTIDAACARSFRLPRGLRIVAGTTDGVAAFLAAGATRPGEGVTSLGSTLVLKLLSDIPVFAPQYGVYSHRLGDHWLAGGASNTGGAALLKHFTVEQLREMTPKLSPERPTGLDYYPLPAVGERFPISDPHMQPIAAPIPENPVTFFQGLLEGIARIEAEGYRVLAALGAPPVTAVFSTGGGSRNTGWERIRARTLGVEMKKPRSHLSAYGTALLASGLPRSIDGKNP